MKILLCLVLTLVFTVLLFSVKTNALTAELLSEEDNIVIYQILAEPPQESSAVQFRVNVTGGTILDVSPGDTEDLSILPVCENNERFFEQEVCIEIASIGGLINTDQVLVKITLEKSPEQEIIFTANQDHAYLTTSGQLINENGVVLDTYNISTLEELPAPVIEEAVANESNSLPFVLLIGILVVLVGAFLVIVIFSKKEPTDQINN